MRSETEASNSVQAPFPGTAPQEGHLPAPPRKAGVDVPELPRHPRFPSAKRALSPSLWQFWQLQQRSVFLVFFSARNPAAGEFQKQETHRSLLPASRLNLSAKSLIIFFCSVGEKRQRCPEKLLLRAGTPGRCNEAQRRGHRVWARRSQLSIVTR